MADQPTAHLSTPRLILLTMGFVGLQLVFSLIFSNGSAFLRSLGLHDSVIALVWLGGPVCGAVLQPYFGLCSEHCRSSWGRRRPYIVAGAVAVVASLLGLACVDAVAATTATTATTNTTTTTGARAGAILGTIALNAAIQPLQGGLRALLVDASPPHQLATANAWASRLTSLASVVGYLAGFLDLTGQSSPLGSSQFRVLCLLSAVAVICSITLTCVAVRENPNTEPDPDTRPEIEEAALKQVVPRLAYLCTRFHQLPSSAQRVCCIQFFSWLAWAPYLYYIALYIGDIYQRQVLELDTQETSNRHLTQDATRMGSLGLLLFATTALLAGIAFPMMLLQKPAEEHAYSEVQTEDGREQRKSKPAQEGKPDAHIQRIWMWSHVIYATCILSTSFVTSLWGTYVLVGFCGISWAVTIWAPFSLVSIAIRGGDDDGEEEEEEEEMVAGGNGYGHVSGERVERRPGVVLALHNTAISAPQIVAVAISSIVFHICGSSSSSSSNIGGHYGGIAWTLRITALSAIVAAVIARRGIKQG